MELYKTLDERYIDDYQSRYLSPVRSIPLCEEEELVEEPEDEIIPECPPCVVTTQTPIEKNCLKTSHFLPNSAVQRDKQLYRVSRVPFRGNEYMYVRKKIKGCVFGAFDGMMSASSSGMKWGGHGGWIAGSITCIAAYFVGFTEGFLLGGIYGLLTNDDEVTSYWRHYREFLVSGVTAIPSRNTYYDPVDS